MRYRGESELSGITDRYGQKTSQLLKVDLFFVVLPGFEPGQTEPKPVVLPLHHRTIIIALSCEERCKGSTIKRKKQIFFLFLVPGRSGTDGMH